jgi:hypothetical protein
MPLVLQPILRQRQKARENNGLIQARDTVTVTQIKAAEAGGRFKDQTPAFVILRGTKYSFPLSGA